MSGNTKDRKKILVVDDNEMHLVTVELFLKNEYEIIKMKSGKEALDFFHTSEIIPDIILLDILMPEMDGWELFKKMREISKLKDIPIVFLTTIDDKEEKKRALKMGISDYIIKPYNMAVLKKNISDLVK